MHQSRAVLGASQVVSILVRAAPNLFLLEVHASMVNAHNMFQPLHPLKAFKGPPDKPRTFFLLVSVNSASC